MAGKEGLPNLAHYCATKFGVIGLTQSLGGQLIGVKWTDVMIFSILIFVMVLRPSGLLGVRAPQKA